MYNHVIVLSNISRISLFLVALYLALLIKRMRFQRHVAHVALEVFWWVFQFYRIKMDLTVLSTCPVCYEIIREPVMFPCKHEICLTCFKKSLETANHWCPICRKRISSWARRNVNNPVSSERKRKIEEVLAKCDINTLMKSTESTNGRQPPSRLHIPYSRLFSYGGHFCIEEHRTKIKTTKLFYSNRFYVTILSCTKIRVVRTSICTNENYSLYGRSFCIDQLC